MQALGKTSLVIAAIGAIVWGLIGVFRWNLVNAIFGGPAFMDAGVLSRIIYVLVGLAGVVALAYVPSIGERRLPGESRTRRGVPGGGRTAPTA
jgi:hypothetical protein